MRAPLALIEASPPGADRVVVLRGELDVGSTPSLSEWLSRSSDGGRHAVVVDFARVEFMAVSALYVLADEQARMAQHRARLTLVCARQRLLQLFEVCRLGDAMCIVPSREHVPAGPWTDEDDVRAATLDAWLGRYAAASA